MTVNVKQLKEILENVPEDFEIFYNFGNSSKKISKVEIDFSNGKLSFE